MSKATLLIPALAAFMTLGARTQAQQRSVNMEVVLVSPASDGVFEGGEQVSLKVDLKNNGPDALIYGDSLFIYLPDGKVHLVSLEQALGEGQTMTIVDAGMTFAAPDATITTDICVYLYDNPSVQITMGGSPISVSYLDPDSVNNLDCNEITVKAGVPSTLNDVTTIQPLQLYPNPASDHVRIPISGQKVVEAQVWVRDLTGRALLSRNYGRVDPELTPLLELEVTTLSPGMYWVETEAGLLKSVGRLAIQR